MVWSFFLKHALTGFDALALNSIHSDFFFCFFFLFQERQADRLRYAGLPRGDHSLVVEGLGQFAPSGSYAHSGSRGGLGDEEEVLPLPLLTAVL